MEDLSHITVPKMTATDSFAVLPQEVMDGFSGSAQLDQASRLMGFPSETVPEVVADEGSE